jgi:3-hydroxybutyryl-CoA dehydratase
MQGDNKSYIGRTYQSREPLLITADRIAAFCESVDENNPLYVDPEAAKAGPYGGIIAPPAFVASFRYADNVFDQLPVFAGGGLMAGIDLELHGPIRPGDRIKVVSEIKEAYEKTGRTGTMTFVVVRSELTNQDGVLIAHVDHRMMRRL